MRHPANSLLRKLPGYSWTKGINVDRFELAHRFRFHPADTPEKQAAHARVRSECGDLAEFLNGILPEGREKALAMTNLEETMMWGNAAIARAKAPGTE